MKKKCLYIVPPARNGGLENHVYTLLQHAKSLGYEPILMSLADAPFEHKFYDLNIKIIKLSDDMVSSIRSITNIFPLIKHIKENQPDIVHCHGPRALIIGAVAARLAGVKNIILTVHSSYKLMAYDNNNKLRYSMLLVSKIMHLIAFGVSRKIIFVSEQLLEEFKEAYLHWPLVNKSINSKKVIVRNGVNLKRFGHLYDQNTLKQSLGIKNNAAVVGFVGRLDPMKGVQNLIRAISSLLKSDYHVDLLVIGEGYYQNRLEKLAEKLGVGANIHFLGYSNDPVKWYNTMDVFVLPSLSEGFPLVTLEAMACGVPVIVTDVGGASEIVDNFSNGLIVPPDDSDRLGCALKWFLIDKKRREKVAITGEKFVTAQFTEEKMLNNIFQLYK